MKPIIFLGLLLVAFTTNAQSTYPARVVDGPNFAHELFQTSEYGLVSKVPHLVRLNLDYGIANWYWTCNPSVAAATSYINVEFQLDYRGFTMTMPGGGEKFITLKEAGITATGFSIADIKLDIEFGKINTRATATIDYSGKFGEKRKGMGSVRFINDGRDAFSDFTKFDNKKKRYMTVEEIFSGLDPQVSIAHKGSFNTSILSAEDAFRLNQIKKYIEKVYAENDKESRFNTLKAEAEQSASIGNIDEAIQKYQEAYMIKNDPAIKSRIEALQTQQKANENKEETESLLSQARDAENTGDLERAKQLYKKAVEQSGNSGIQNDIARVDQAIASNASTSQGVSQDNTSSQTTQTSGYSSGFIQNNEAQRQQDWAAFNRKQEAVDQWMQEFDQSIKTGEQNRQIKQQQYDQLATGLANTVGSYLQKIDQEQEQKKINKRKRLINDAVYNAYSPLYDDIDFWSNFQKRLIDFANAHKNSVSKEGMGRLNSSMNAIQRSLEGIKRQLDEMKNSEAHNWQYVSDMNDIFVFPLSEWKNKSYSKATPVIGYDLAILLGTGRAIPDKQERVTFINDAASLLADFSVRLQSYDYVASAAKNFEEGGGTNYRFKELIKNARAIKNYIQLKDLIQQEYDAFVKELKKNKGFVTIKNTNSKIHFEGITPLVGEGVPSASLQQQKVNKQEQELNKYAVHIRAISAKDLQSGQSMNTLFPRIDELSASYKSLENTMGEFQPLYRSLKPDKVADFNAGGYYVEPGKVTILMSQEYMEPDPLKVTLDVAAGQQQDVNLANYAKGFHIVKYFKPYSVDLNKQRFRLEKCLFPAARNRRFPNSYKFNLAFTTYNYGLSEISTTLIGSKTYFGMRGYAKSKTAFFTNLEVARLFYGKGKIITGYETADGSIYEHNLTDMSFYGTDLGIGGLGLAQGLFGGQFMLEFQASASVLSVRYFKVKATEERKSGAGATVATGEYPYNVMEYCALQGKIALNTHLGKVFLNIEYSINFYPLVGESDLTLGEKGDISQLSNNYRETQTAFFEDINNKYFNKSLTVYFLF